MIPDQPNRLAAAKIWPPFSRLLLILHLLSPFCTNAQKVQFEFFTTANGLAGNNTSTVTQDKQGFLWFVNEGKMHRYDGHNFVLFPTSQEESVMGLTSTKDSLLFVWDERRPFLFDPQTGDLQSLLPESENTYQDEAFLWQKIGQNQVLISGFRSDREEVTIWRLSEKHFAPLQLPEYITLTDSYFWVDIDEAGTTYLAFQDTLYQAAPEGTVLRKTPLNSVCNNCYNLCFQFGKEGELVLMANWRFFILDRHQNRFVPHPANRFLPANRYHLHRFILEENGSLWACGQDRNLVYYDARQDTLYNFHEELKTLLPSANDFKGLFRDRTGIIWIDTRLGLLKVKPQALPFNTYFNGLNSNNTYFSFRGLTEDSRGLIYGFYYDGIARLDPVREQPGRLYTFPFELFAFDLYAVGNRIWINGGQYLDLLTGRLERIPNTFFDKPVGDNGFFAEDRNGVLWWLAHYSLYYLQTSDQDSRWVKALEFPEKVLNKTEALHAGRHSGYLWLSFKGRLLRYDPATGEQHWLNPTDWGLAVSRIMSIEEDRESKLWLATDAGLIYADPAGVLLRHYQVKDGLPNNFICGLLTEGDSCLWLSTNNGLSRFHIPTGTFNNFYEEDGLTYNEFNRKSYLKARNGRMFFGGMRGINAFFPNEVIQALQNRNKGARMVLTAFAYTDERKDTIFHQNHFAKQPEVHLRYWDWSYRFEYALTDFSNPEEIFYSYKMEGYKDSWSAPSRFNFTRFNSLPDGQYTFRVRARDGRGQWHPDELAVKVIVHPAWWDTWWAYVVYGGLLFVLLYFLRRYEMNRQRLKYSLDLEKVEARRLKELDHFKSRLYTNLTHEFRTPLTVILGMARQLATGPWQSSVTAREKGRLAQGLTLIENNGQNLLRLINQLLDLSKLENHSFRLRLLQDNIVPYLRYVTESFQSFANGQNLALRFFTPTETLVMDYDPEQIKQVLVNLISNAIKFTPPGGEVTVRLTPQEERLLIEVRDTGAGIGAGDLPHIFDRFYQADTPSTRTGQGTGIGLAHALELVKLMQGDIAVESQPGKGTVFTVTLPVTREAPPATGPVTVENRGAPPPTTSQPPAGGQEAEPAAATLPQLLIIEDNADVVTYLRSCLAGRYRLEVAYNGRIGIEMALEEVPDLIISDVMMPEKDGFEVCDTLKNDERTSHIPLILLTAKADAASKIAGLRRGADAYLSKPFDKEELLVRLEMLMERQKRMATWLSRTQAGADDTPAPDAETQEAIQVEDAFIGKVRAIIEAHYTDEHFALPQLCQEIGMSRSQLFRKMKALIDTSPSDFIRSFRLQQAKILLETTDLTVSEVSWKVGFKDPAHFSRSYQEAFGYPPSETGG